jgi:hypothetical protein
LLESTAARVTQLRVFTGSLQEVDDVRHCALLRDYRRS